MATKPRSAYADRGTNALIDGLIAHWRQASAIGAASGLTIVDADLANHASYQGQMVHLLLGNGASGQTRWITNDTTAGSIIVNEPFTDRLGAAYQVPAGARYCILPNIGESDIAHSGTTTARGRSPGAR